MATIQRTFKDPALQNPLKYLGYDSIPVEIEHGGASENYFNVQGIGPELHAGKNIFYIKPDAETLVLNAEIGVEILDANGDLVPVRLLDNRRSDGSIGLVIERVRKGTDYRDGLMWFCDKCNHKLYEERFTLDDIVNDFLEVFRKFYNSEENRTCEKCNHIMETDPKFTN